MPEKSPYTKAREARDEALMALGRVAYAKWRKIGNSGDETLDAACKAVDDACADVALQS